MKVLRTTGPPYNTQSPIPVRYYQWKCPKCGDICEDPANVHESSCHNGHEVKLTLTEDGGVYEHMVAEFELPEFIFTWNTHNFATEGGHKIHLLHAGIGPAKRRSLCGHVMEISQLGSVIPDLEKWINGAEKEICANCLRVARKLLR